MKQLTWLKQKDVGNDLTQVFIKPEFFDFTKTKYPDGIPILGSSLSKEEVKNLFNKAENYIQDNITSLVENSEEDDEISLERLEKDWKENPENFFVMRYSDVDFEKEKAFFYPRIVLPYVDHDEHIFNHGIAINDERIYSHDGFGEKYKELNQLLFEITKKHLSLI